MTLTCHLAAGGPTETPAAFLDWANRAEADARRAFQGQGRLVAHVWPYRHGLGECLSCDVWYDAEEGSQEVFPITFVVDGKVDLSDTSEPHVLDMSDALHIAGIVLKALNARITLARPGTGASIAETKQTGAVN